MDVIVDLILKLSELASGRHFKLTSLFFGIALCHLLKTLLILHYDIMCFSLIDYYPCPVS